jgi:hypothetical protein
MSEQQPPSGTPEYLEYGAGEPIPPAPPVDGPPARRARRAWWIGGGVVALLGTGAGAWAALSFFQQGSQPAEALPSTTVAYVSLDLDPSGGQKIDAFRTLNKFPAFKDQVGVNSVDDLRHKIGDSLISESGCSGLDYSRDIDPWLGDRMAGAVVPLADGKPHVVAVVQVTDDDKALAGIHRVERCAGSGAGDTGVVVKNGWAILAQSQEVADEVSTATGEGTLAADATYQKWTKAVGDAGVVNAYLSPDAGQVLAKELSGFLGDGLFTGGMPMSLPPGATASYSAAPGTTVQSSAFHATADDGDDPLTQALSGFQGGAATLRFTGDGLEVSAAGDGSSPQLSALTGTTGGELVSRLPGDTAAAAGTSLAPGWLKDRLDAASGLLGRGLSGGDAQRDLSRGTGLRIPHDIETLLGSGVALSVSKDIDLEAAENSTDGAGVPVAATVKGDPAAIDQVLDKIRARAGDLPALGSDSSGDLVVVGPSEAYRKQVLSGGSLGDDDTFTGVVPDADHASSVLYLDIDALEPALSKLMSGPDAHDLANLTPLRAIGMSTWNDDGLARFSFDVTTN